MITPEIHNDLYIMGLIWIGSTLAVCVAWFFAFSVIPWLMPKFKRLILRIQIIACDVVVWFIRNRHRMRVRKQARRYERTRSYGRNIVREKHNTYRRRLVTSWFICGIVGVIIGVVSTMVVYGF